MTTWTPSLKSRKGPTYIAIADALAEDVRSGRLAGGARLPTHRDLAGRLRVTVGTVTRAYSEAARRGMIVGEVGRGTFVRGAAEAAEPFFAPEIGDTSVIDLSLNYPVSDPHSRHLQEALAALAARPETSALLHYHTHAGLPRHREAGAAWIARWVPDARPERLLVTTGGQHAMAVTFAALARPGDVVLTESLTYTGMKFVADLLGLRLRGVPMDEHGLLPGALDGACAESGARLLYCMPTVQNPTGAVMPEERRREIADVARRRQVVIVEDDIYGFLAPEAPPPLATRAPDLTYFITSASKCLAPGLRIGYVLAPPGGVERLTAVIRATCWMSAPLTAEVASRWIEDGTADRLVEWRRKEAAARQVILRKILQGSRITAHPAAYHAWLDLPEPWTGTEFAARVRMRGVALAPADAFHVGRGPAPPAVRICLGAAGGRERLEQGLRIVAETLREPTAPTPPVL